MQFVNIKVDEVEISILSVDMTTARIEWGSASEKRNLFFSQYVLFLD